MGKPLLGLWAWTLGLMAMAAQAGEPLVTEGFVNAPVAEVWRLFTTSEGYTALGPAHAEVDLRVGGTIRVHRDPKGTLGDPETAVNEILAYDPERMLAIRNVKAPASFAYSKAWERAWTVVYFTRSGEDMAHVRIVMLGIGDDEESQAMRRLFTDGYRASLDSIAKRYWPQCALCKKEPAAKQ